MNKHYPNINTAEGRALAELRAVYQHRMHYLTLAEADARGRRPWMQAVAEADRVIEALVYVITGNLWGRTPPPKH